MPPVPNIVVGQAVSEAKVIRSKQLRSEMTPTERILWSELRANRLQGLKFRRQQIIDGFIVDFYCHGAGVVVELDGPVHDEKKEADAERECVLTGRGLLVLRFTNDEIQTDLNSVVEKIAGVCRQRITF